MSTTKTIKRPCIEVDTGSSGNTGDPVRLFAHKLRMRYGGTDEVEESNRTLMESLITRGQIPRSSIVWHGESISKIYGFKIGERGKIEYDSPSRGLPKKANQARVVDTGSQINVQVLRDAIIRSKQMAI